MSIIVKYIPDIANSLAQTISDNSSSEQYSTKFQSFRRQAENNPLNFKSNNTETYNNPFLYDEWTHSCNFCSVVDVDSAPRASVVSKDPAAVDQEPVTIGLNDTETWRRGDEAALNTNLWQTYHQKQ